MRPVRYLALGDSYTIGIGATGPAASLPALLARRVERAAGRPVDVVNPAVNGFTSADLIRAALPLLDDVRPDLVSVLVGANDVVQRSPDYERNLRATYDALAAALPAPHAVLALSIPNWARTPAAADLGEPSELESRIRELNRLARREASRRGFLWADVFELSSSGGGAGWLSDDGLHPGDAQYAAWAEATWEAVGARWVGGLRAEASPALTYAAYLALDEVLGAQRPRSEEHDELLFIVIHQVYELWFKQLLHEFAALQARLERGHAAGALATLQRVRAILKTVVAQVDVLETMTPRQFTAFRGRLEAASGFQSAQFRELEAVLGRRQRGVLAAHRDAPAAEARIAAAMSRPSLYDSFLRFLASQGYAVPAELLDRDFGAAAAPSPAAQEVLLRVYADDGPAAQVAERMVDLDEGLQEWRYRHVKMVERTIGDKAGTAGSSGADYLRGTLFRPAFPDLWAVRARL